LKEYSKALGDEEKIEELGYPVDSGFINELKNLSQER